MIMRVMLCFIPAEKTVAGIAAKQDSQRQGTKEAAEGMQQFKIFIDIVLSHCLFSHTVQCSCCQMLVFYLY